MCDNVYLPSASSTESCDTSYSSSKEEMAVASTVKPYKGEPLLKVYFMAFVFVFCGEI